MTEGRWQLLPPLSDEEYRALKADIAAQGVLVPVVIDADSGETVEGHHRLRAWTELRAEGVKMPPYPREVRRFASDDERISFVVAANLFRRHLSCDQRVDLVARLRSEGWSLRRIGDAVGVEEITVRRDLEGATYVAPERIEGADRKSYPVRCPSIVVDSDRDQSRERRHSESSATTPQRSSLALARPRSGHETLASPGFGPSRSRRGSSVPPTSYDSAICAKYGPTCRTIPSTVS